MVIKEILVIDDSDESRLYVRKVMEGAGYSVRESTNIVDGLASAKERVPHLVILDLVMPGGSGFEFLEQKRKQPAIAAIPVLVLSGLSDKGTVYRANALGAKEYVSKPVDARVLVRKVHKIFMDSKFQGWVFDEKSRPRVTALAPARILNANEVGILVEAPLKVAPNMAVEIRSPLLDELSCADAVFHRTGTPAKGGFPGQYLNEVAVVGLSDAAVKKIRLVTRGW